MLLDLRYALRLVLKQPLFSAIAVPTLKLGIGANTAIFSVVNAVLLSPLGYPESQRLVWMSETGPNFPTMSIAYPNFTDWREQQNVFEYIGVYNEGSYNLTGSGEPERLRGERISADGLSALRVSPVLGRLFTNEEDRPGAPPVVLSTPRARDLPPVKLESLGRCHKPTCSASQAFANAEFKLYQLQEGITDAMRTAMDVPTPKSSSDRVILDGSNVANTGAVLAIKDWRADMRRRSPPFVQRVAHSVRGLQTRESPWE